MKKDERLNALEIALNNESREREFYLTHARRTKNPVGKAMFQQIADEELEHYERLQELHEKWQTLGSWPETIPLIVKGTVVKDVLKTVISKIDQLPPTDNDDLQAVREAIAFEAKGAKTYADLCDQVTDAREKQFFSLLSDIETEHYLSLKDTEELLTDPASWYRKKERSGLDGA